MIMNSMIISRFPFLFILLFIFVVPLLLASQARGSLPEPYKETRMLLHTFVEIKAYGANAKRAAEASFAEMERVNRLLNNYDPSSEISQINRAASLKSITISPETLEALTSAKYYGELSGGAFDITVGPLLELWGFNQEEPGIKADLPLPDTLDRVRQLVDYRLIQLDTIKGTAMLLKKGMWIDSGSFAKGYAVDRAASVLKKQGVTQALITAGGTILALGKKTGGKPWQIGVRHPREEGTLLDTIPLVDQSISTSGDYERFYYYRGRRVCHIIDPRSGYPVEAVQGISVIAPTAMASDALSTVLFVLGVQKGLSLVENLPGVEAMIIDQEGKVYLSPGWPARIKQR